MATNARCKAELLSVDLVDETTLSTASQMVPIAPWIALIDPGHTMRVLGCLTPRVTKKVTYSTDLPESSCLGFLTPAS